MRRAKQFELKLPSGHGGARPGAGRPKTSRFQPHVARTDFSSRHPLHVTLRLMEGLPSLRRKDVFRVLREAVKKARARGLKIIHFAILSNHIHLIVEAPSKTALARQLQGFSISLGKGINRLAGRKGRVFAERYHLHVLKTPAEVRNALEYVLTNEGSHEARTRGRKKGPLRVKYDPFSSASAFQGWKALGCRTEIDFEPTAWSDAYVEAWLDEALSPAGTWLLRAGWRKLRRRG